jgi:hypothetical protein
MAEVVPGGDAELIGPAAVSPGIGARENLYSAVAPASRDERALNSAIQDLSNGRRAVANGPQNAAPASEGAVAAAESTWLDSVMASG